MAQKAHEHYGKAVLTLFKHPLPYSFAPLIIPPQIRDARECRTNIAGDSASV
jgi:hypothetical protein